MQPQWETIKGTSYPNGKSSHKAVLGYSLEVHPSPRYAAQGQLTSELTALVERELCSQLMIQDEASFAPHLRCQKETEHEDR